MCFNLFSVNVYTRLCTGISSFFGGKGIFVPTDAVSDVNQLLKHVGADLATLAKVKSEPSDAGDGSLVLKVSLKLNCFGAKGAFAFLDKLHSDLMTSGCKTISGSEAGESVS